MMRPMSPEPRITARRPTSKPLHIQKALRRASGVHAGRALARDGDGPARALAAAHRQHDSPRLERLGAARSAQRAHGGAARRRPRAARPAPIVSSRTSTARGGQLFDEAARVFRAGELLAEAVQAEAVVDALIQNAAELTVPLEEQDAPQTRLPRGLRGGQPRGPAADHDQFIHRLHRLSRGPLRRTPSTSRAARAALLGWDAQLARDDGLHARGRRNRPWQRPMPASSSAA